MLLISAALLGNLLLVYIDMTQQTMKRSGAPLQKAGDNPEVLPVIAIGKFLWEQARKSERVLLQLAEALLRPEPFLPCVPRLAHREAVTAIRVARLAPTDLRMNSEDRKRWQLTEDRLLFSLVANSLPLLDSDAKKTKCVIERMKPPFLPSEVIRKDLADLNELERMYASRAAALEWDSDDSSEMRKAKKAERVSLRRPPRSDRGGRGVRPDGGKPISESTRRLVATFYLLKSCGRSDPAGTIHDLFKKLGIVRSASKIREAVAIYERAAESRRADAFIPPSDLPEYWLQWQGQLEPKIIHEFGFVPVRGFVVRQPRQRLQMLTTTTFRSQVTI